MIQLTDTAFTSSQNQFRLAAWVTPFEASQSWPRDNYQQTPGIDGYPRIVLQLILSQVF
jgi:hypothetical protein